MADRIHATTEWLDKCAKDLDAISSTINDAAGILAGIKLRKDEGGDLRVSMMISMRMNRIHYSGSFAKDDISALQRATSALSRETATFSTGAKAAAQIFDRAEKAAIQLVQGTGLGTNAGVYDNPGGGRGNSGEGIGTVLWELIKWAVKKWDNNTPSPAEAPVKQRPSTDPFDESGMYGGNQSDIKTDYENHQRYKKIIERNTDHKLTADEFENYLNRMGSEGCGYIALCNAIFAAYKDNPEGFERAFGFSMYNDKDLNYNELFVDLYSRWDNRTSIRIFNPRGDYDPDDDSPMDYSYWNDPSGNGTKIEWRSEIIQKYLKSYGISSKTESHGTTTLTADKYNEMVAKGLVEKGQLQIRMSGDPAYLYNADGKIVSSYSGGHAMTVTGTTGSGKDAMLIVSSWGKTYYVKPNDFCNLDKNGKPTGSMGYMIVRIKAQ